MAKKIIAEALKETALLIRFSRCFIRMTGRRRGYAWKMHEEDNELIKLIMNWKERRIKNGRRIWNTCLGRHRLQLWSQPKRRRMNKMYGLGFHIRKEQNFNIPETLMQHPIPTFAADRQECRSEIYQPKFLIMGTFELIIASVMAILVVVSNISSVGRIWQR